MARRVGDRATLAYTLDGTYAALSLPEGMPGWVDTTEEMTRLAEEAGDREQLYAGRVHALGASMVLGDLQAVAAELRLLTDLAEELRQPAQTWSMAIARGMLAAFAGRNEEADQLMQQVAEAGPGVHGLDATFYYALNLQQWAVRRAQGRLAEIGESVKGFVEENRTWPLVRCTLASMLSELGQEEQAARARPTGDRRFRRGSPRYRLVLRIEPAGGGLRRPRRHNAGGASVRAPGTASRLQRHRHPEVALGCASRYLGLLATTLSRWDQASRHFEDAIAMNRRMGAAPWIAHTQADYARMLRTRDGPGDAEKAAELTHEALTIYRRLGMESWATKVAETGDSLPTRR